MAKGVSAAWLKWLSCWMLLVAMSLLAACSGPREEVQLQRLLFVGNSLTYVGNLPAVYSALAIDNGHAVASDMIVRGGATLSQRVDDGSVARALATTRYQTLVLQERGGDLMCSFGPDSCAQSRAALAALVELARVRGVEVVLLGSYQPHPAASRRLVEMESAAAAQVGIAYVEVSQTMQRLQAQAPDLAWFAPDGAHPGADLTLMKAMLLYRTLHGEFPRAAALAVDAPIHAVSSGLTETLRPAQAPPPHSDTPARIDYPAATLRLMHGALRAAEREAESPDPA